MRTASSPHCSGWNSSLDALRQDTRVLAGPFVKSLTLWAGGWEDSMKRSDEAAWQDGYVRFGERCVSSGTSPSWMVRKGEMSPGAIGHVWMVAGYRVARVVSTLGRGWCRLQFSFWLNWALFLQIQQMLVECIPCSRNWV